MEQRNPRLRWLIVWVLAVVWMAAVLARLGTSSSSATANTSQKPSISSSEFSKSARCAARFTIARGGSSRSACRWTRCSRIRPRSQTWRWSRGCFGRAERARRRTGDKNSRGAYAGALGEKTFSGNRPANQRNEFERRIFQKENRRVYPQRELAASVLGYVDVDEKGIGGIEYSLDKEIRGRPGKMMVMADGRRR